MFNNNLINILFPKYIFMKKEEDVNDPKTYKIQRQVQELSATEVIRLSQRLKDENPDIVLLLNALYKNKKESHTIHKASLYRQVFGPGVYNDQKLRKLMFKLGKHIEQFFIQTELQADRHLQQLLLAKALSKRSSYMLFEEAVSKAIHNRQEEGKKGMDYYKAMAELHSLLFFHHGSPQNLPEDVHLKGMVAHLDAYFSLSTLEYGAEIQLRKRIVSEKIEQRYLPAVIEHSAGFPEQEGQLIGFFSRLLSLLAKEKTPATEVNALVEDYLQLAGSMSEDDSGLALKWLLNLVLTHTNNGVKELYIQEFNLYKMGLDNKLLLENGFLTGTRFTNIVVCAVLAGQMDWTQSFIDAYENKVDKVERTYAVLHGKAYWQYFKGLEILRANGPIKIVNTHFEQCRQNLDRLINSRNENYNIRARGLQARLHYEWFKQDGSYWDILIDGLAAFEQFLRRRKDLAQRRIQAYLSFVSLLRKLTMIETDPDDQVERLEQLGQQVVERDPLILRNWLLEKIDAAKEQIKGKDKKARD